MFTKIVAQDKLVPKDTSSIHQPLQQFNKYTITNTISVQWSTGTHQRWDPCRGFKCILILLPSDVSKSFLAAWHGPQPSIARCPAQWKKNQIIRDAHMCPCNYSDMFWCRNLDKNNELAGRIALKGKNGANTSNFIRRNQVIKYLKTTGNECGHIFASQAELSHHLEERASCCKYHEYLHILLSLVKSQIDYFMQTTSRWHSFGSWKQQRFEVHTSNKLLDSCP